MFEEFRTRSLETERLDRGEFTHDEYARWQKEMCFIHRLFGETRALKRELISNIGDDDRISILDVGAGSGTLLSYLRDKLTRIQVQTLGLEMSRESAIRIRDNRHIAVRGNAITLPFADNSIDYVFCTLVLHHLSDSLAVELIREMRRVAKRKLIVIDLERSVFSYVMFKLMGTLFLQRFTRDDGSLSIKRAFTVEELREIMRDSSLSDIKVVRSAIGRLILTSDG